MQKPLCTYGLSSEQLGGVMRSRTAVRDNLGRFASDAWKDTGFDNPDVLLRFFLFCVWV